MPIELPFPEPDEVAELPAPEAVTADPASPREKAFNYFNYFTEIEEAFVARRGAAMLVSPLDWALMEGWQREGIPLHIVLRGIARAFDRRDEKEPENPLLRVRKVNSIAYCQQAVMTAFVEWRQSQVGKSSGSTEEETTEETAVEPASDERDPFPSSLVANFLELAAGDLERARLTVPRFASEEYPHIRYSEALGRVAGKLRDLVARLGAEEAGMSMQRVEDDLTTFEDLLFDALRADTPPETLAELTKEAAGALKPYKKRMDKPIYEQTLENYLGRQLRTRYGVPRLSLFYLHPE